MTQSSRAMLARCELRTHARQNIITRAQTDEESKRDQPDTQTKV